MDYTKTCIDCGIEFIAHGKKALRCIPCRRESENRKDRERRAKKAELRCKEPKPEDAFSDSPENIAICLSCTKEICVLEKDKRCEIFDDPKKPKEKKERKTIDKTCVDCGAKFSTKSGRAIRCSLCAKERQKTQIKQAMERYKELKGK